jgi:hypothetical protein
MRLWSSIAMPLLAMMETPVQLLFFVMKLVVEFASVGVPRIALLLSTIPVTHAPFVTPLLVITFQAE